MVLAFGVHAELIGREFLGDVGIDVQMILNWILKKRCSPTIMGVRI